MTRRRRPNRTPKLALTIGAWLLASGAAAGSGARLVEGLDHTPVAVSDLDRAAADFARLGFAIKPGRPHGDGIHNRHIKFPNGGEIELITASSPTDDLARAYVDWLRGGDGPASWSLYAPDLPALANALSKDHLGATNQGDVVTLSSDLGPHRLFFADRLRSPTDGPAFWTHANSAYRLSRVWLATAPIDERVMAALGVGRAGRFACAPFDHRAELYVIPGDGDEVAVSRALDRPESRSVVGVTVLVGSLAAAKRVLAANRIPFSQPRDCGHESLWIAPEQAHGLWLELRVSRRNSRN